MTLTLKMAIAVFAKMLGGIQQHFSNLKVSLY